MIIWILMILDILSLVSLTFIQFKIHIAIKFFIIPSLYLIGKGFFFKDFMSIVDSLAGIYLLVAFLFGISSFIYYILLGWFLYKLFFVILLNAIKF